MDHLTQTDLATLLRGGDMRRASSYLGHLENLCEECWRTVSSGLLVRRIIPKYGRPSAPDPLRQALWRLVTYHTPGAEHDDRKTILRLLGARHRRALRQAREKRAGILLVILAECEVELPRKVVERAEMTPVRFAREAVKHLSHIDVDPSAYSDFQAWGMITLGRAAHRQGAPGDRIRQCAQSALAYIDKGTGNPDLRAAVLELRSLVPDITLAERERLLDEALALVSGGDDLLQVEMLAAKARCLTWRPEEAVKVARRALGLIEANDAPRLALGLLDGLSRSLEQLGEREEARSVLLAAQALSEVADEEVFSSVRRLAEIARLTLTENPEEAERWYRLAVSGYRDLDHDDDTGRRLGDLAELHVRVGDRKRFAGVEEELSRWKASHPTMVAGIASAAHSAGLPLTWSAGLQNP